ncbi:hypothetical protein ALI22I_42290 [Saccharothrix sp. ALI-22-I]|uniref:DUF6069 family protein n=1 Tax=Saccharothrix sp. ALI-22-I TaxID=1933778 RepID=UPI00097C6F05|nr:DUF6069 family protein [Saccharothrix sp. ALI-22-I]ONI80067.1 hypothetical protein ALI22I_42290 [Saccharothrix sp. ALI-22-I]
MESSKGRVVLGVLAAIVVASVGNTVVSFAAQAFGASPDVIQGLAPQAYVFLTTVGVVVAAVAWALIRAKAKRPNALLRKLVPIVVVVSLLPDLSLFGLANASPIGVIALMLMHFVVAGVAVPIFTKVLPLPADAPSTAAVPA